MSKVIYLVHHSRLDREDGYSQRTHRIALHLIKNGSDVLVVSKINNEKKKSFCEIDGVRYLRLSRDFGSKTVKDGLTEKLVELITEVNPSRLLVASDWTVGQLMARAAATVRMPFAYEMRGLWGLTRVSKRVQEGSVDKQHWVSESAFRRDFDKELKVAKLAEVVFVISEGLRQLVIENGVSNHKTRLVPNGGESDYEQKQVSYKNKVTVAYVGSLSSYEGVHLILEALSNLINKGLPVDGLIVGGSTKTSNHPDNVDRNLDELKLLARKLKISGLVKFTGKLPQEKVKAIYNNIDIIVIPRLDLPVCQIVPPLKPVEAAQYGKAIVCSNVSPLHEIVEQGGALEFNVGCVDDLTRVLSYLLENDENLNLAKEKSFRWIKTFRTSDNVYKPICDYLTSSHGTSWSVSASRLFYWREKFRYIKVLINRLTRGERQH